MFGFHSIFAAFAARKKDHNIYEMPPRDDADAEPKARPHIVEEPDPLTTEADKLFAYGRQYAINIGALTPDTKHDIEVVLRPVAQQAAEGLHQPFTDEARLLAEQAALKARKGERVDEQQRVETKLLELRRALPDKPGLGDLTFAAAAATFATGAGIAIAIRPVFDFGDGQINWVISAAVGLAFGFAVVTSILSLDMSGNKDKES